MQKSILITGASDGIGLITAKMLIEQGHHVILHGRNAAKLQEIENQLATINQGKFETIVADLSSFRAVSNMITEITQRFKKLDVLINNAGVYKTAQVTTPDGLDVRFVVNSIAPYQLTKSLLPLFSNEGRIVNLSSAAQACVNPQALAGEKAIGDSDAYAQSKLALTMWSRKLGLDNKANGPVIVSVNPKSFLGSKMVKEAYGIAGGNINQGAEILVRAALSDEFAKAHGAYFDNDIEVFADPHTDALDESKNKKLIEQIEALIKKYS